MEAYAGDSLTMVAQLIGYIFIFCVVVVGVTAFVAWMLKAFVIMLDKVKRYWNKL